MRDGFIKVAAGTPKIRVADCGCNAKNIIELMKEAAAQEIGRASCRERVCRIV